MASDADEGKSFTRIPPAENENDVPWGFAGCVPLWALDRNAKHLPIPEEDKDCCIAWYTGPVVRILWRAFVWTWLLWMAVPILAFLALKDGPHQEAFPSPRSWLLPSLGFPLMGLLYHESLVQGILLVPIARSLACDKPLTVFGISASDFRVWWFVSLVVSMAAHLDVVTSGIVVARIVASDLSDVTMPSLWRRLIQRSSVGKFIACPMSTFAVVGWLAMALQPLYAVLRSFPKKSVDTTGSNIEYDYLGPSSDMQFYETLLESCISHVNVVSHLLDTTRMASMVSPWFEASAKELHASSLTLAELPFAFSQQLKVTTGKFVFFSIFESSYQMNLQVAILGLSRAVHPHHHLDAEILVSLGLSYFMAIVTMVKEYGKANKLKNDIIATDIRACARDAVQDAISENEEIGEDLTKYILGEKSKDEMPELEVDWDSLDVVRRLLLSGLVAQKTIVRDFRIFQAVLALFLVCFGRALLQMWGVLTCPSGLYNIGVGCLELDDL